MEAKEILSGVYRINGKLATKNLVPGRRVYEEELYNVDGVEYRSWTPYRSKLSAAILKGLKNFGIGQGHSVLYLGASTGTTASHVSDIVGKDGGVYCVDLSERSMRDLLKVCQSRPNMLPILADASSTNSYKDVVGKCDIIYQDISARDQAGILLANSQLLKSGGLAYFVIKSQSVDVSKRPEQVFKSELAKLKNHFDILEQFGLEPYDSLHLFAVLRKI